MSEVPTGVGVITCSAFEGVIGCTVSSVVSVSVEPNDEKILFALKKNSQIGEILRQKKNFSLSILSETQHKIAESAGGKLNRLELVSFLEEHVEADTAGNFPIKGSKVAFSLIVDQIFDAIGSDIYLCKVQAASLSQESQLNPLIYFRRSFRRIEGSSN